MTAVEKFELAIMPLVAVGFGRASSALPDRPNIGSVLLIAAVLLLLQGLVRDIGLLVKQRRSGTPSGTPRSACCLCIESTIGAAAVAAGLALLGAGSGHAVTMPPWAWGVLALAVAGFGFAIKDYMVTWNPWRVCRARDHLNIVLTRKR